VTALNASNTTAQIYKENVTAKVLIQHSKASHALSTMVILLADIGDTGSTSRHWHATAHKRCLYIHWIPLVGPGNVQIPE